MRLFPVALSLFVVLAPGTLAEDWPIGAERDLSFLLPGETDFDEVFLRWGTNEVEGEVEWDWACRTYYESVVKRYARYLDVIPCNTFLEVPVLPESLREIACFSIQQVPDARPADLEVVPLVLLEYRRYHTLDKKDKNGGLLVHLFFKLAENKQLKLLYYAVDLNVLEEGDWAGIVQREGAPQETRFLYRDYVGQSCVEEYEILFRRYPEKGLGFAYRPADDWVQTRVHFRPE